MMNPKKLIFGLLKISAGILLVLLLALIVIYVINPDYQIHSPENARVRLVKTDQGYQLLKDGEPFYIHGAAGDGSLERLKNLGGNSIRLYRYYHIDSLVQVADTLGISVMVDLDLPPMRTGFDYDDPEKVDSLIAELKETVNKLKDHPSILIWNIGNELNLFYGEDFEVWKVINSIAEMIHETDPDHPTSTAIPMVWQDMILVRWFCPSIDILNINSFRFTLTPSSTIYTSLYGWQGPYVFGEMGPMGTWQAPANQWNVPIEWDDTRKAAHLTYIYDTLIKPDPKSLGAYAFFWGQKQERTHTWYSLFSEYGEKTPVADELSRIWTGEYKQNRSPQVEGILLNGKVAKENIHLNSGEIYEAEAYVKDPEDDSIMLEWAVFKEGDYRSTFGGDKEWRPQSFPELILEAHDKTVRFQAPEYPGDYRLFIYARDKHHNRGSLNVPFFVVLEQY
ncbi:MAG: hypothetical protein KDE26_00630 [Bacteroidetes bacterium]|nr:hypothetical protein [Bacteroidota bacterium]